MPVRHAPLASLLVAPNVVASRDSKEHSLARHASDALSITPPPSIVPIPRTWAPDIGCAVSSSVPT
ncbi:hypothetical protein [Brachybacterium sacelli]|uniref:hypothetical protein n=1 Tax=Brachybacterium sacelli TaxID=173364 RepID=UPI003605B3B7